MELQEWSVIPLKIILLNVKCKYKHNMQCYITYKIHTLLNNKLNWQNNINVCLGFFSTTRSFPTTFYLSESNNQIFLDFNVFILLVTRSLKSNPFEMTFLF